MFGESLVNRSIKEWIPDNPGEEGEEQSGEHLVERCRLLAAARKLVEEEEMREWETRHARDKKKRKGGVGMEKEKEKEEVEKLASFLGAVYEFFNPVPVIPGVCLCSCFIPLYCYNTLATSAPS